MRQNVLITEKELAWKLILGRRTKTLKQSNILSKATQRNIIPSDTDQYCLSVFPVPEISLLRNLLLGIYICSVSSDQRKSVPFILIYYATKCYFFKVNNKSLLQITRLTCRSTVLSKTRENNNHLSTD